MQNQRDNLALVVSTVVIGILVGIGTIILGLFQETIEWIFLNLDETAAHPAATNVAPVHRLLSLVIAGLIAALLWWFISKKLKPVVSIENGIKGQTFPVSSTLVDIVTQIFYVGAGGPVGREVAPRQLGSLIAQNWMKLLHKIRQVQLNESDRQLLIAAAAGAGFAGVYIAPITGMLFSVEILMKQANKRIVVVSLSMSLIAMLIGSWLHDFKPYYLVGRLNFAPQSIWLVLIIAPVCGVMGALFRKGFKWAGKHRAGGNSILWQLPMISVVTGLIAMVFPQIMGNGRALAQLAMQSQTSSLVKLILLGAAAKAFVSIFTLKSGVAGGTLTPSISIGASIGAAIGFILGLFIPGISIWQAAIIGASALLATSQQAPLMAMFMLFEICHLNYSALLPLGLAVCVAVATGNLILTKKSGAN
ncbi:chloride channel protein [Lentilactobacillus senioris]|uniref:chloride channel protein n=1 Tax=Lentilactobacillus senioris TaxID=931534 RepID=UPI003D2E5417